MQCRSVAVRQARRTDRRPSAYLRSRLLSVRRVFVVRGDGDDDAAAVVVVDPTVVLLADGQQMGRESRVNVGVGGAKLR